VAREPERERVERLALLGVVGLIRAFGLTSPSAATRIAARRRRRRGERDRHDLPLRTDAARARPDAVARPPAMAHRSNDPDLHPSVAAVPTHPGAVRHLVLALFRGASGLLL
jgi:hypothetical protein